MNLRATGFTESCWKFYENLHVHLVEIEL